MVSRRSMSVLVVLVLTVVGTRADAQVRLLGAALLADAVQQASCVGGVGCGSGGCMPVTAARYGEQPAWIRAVAVRGFILPVRVLVGRRWLANC